MGRQKLLLCPGHGERRGTGHWRKTWPEAPSAVTLEPPTSFAPSSLLPLAQLLAPCPAPGLGEACSGSLREEWREPLPLRPPPKPLAFTVSQA